MKNFTLIIILFSFLISQSAFSQKTKLIYFFNGNKIDCKKVEKEKINLKIIYSKPESTNIKKGISPITGSVLDWGISKLLDPLAKAIYNPKNYIYTSKSKYRFITNKKIEIFNNAKEIKYTKEDDKEISLEIDFSLNKLKINDSYKFLLLNISQLKLKKTRSKITKRKSKINLIIEIELEYFDSYGKRNTINLTPFQIDNIKPKLKGYNIDVKENNWVIPNFVIYNSIIVKVTEVNSDKKKMDKWRKIIYEDNKEAIKTKIIENITKKDGS